MSWAPSCSPVGAVRLSRFNVYIPNFPDPGDTGNPPTIKSASVQRLEELYTTGALAQMDVAIASASARADGNTAAQGPSLTADLEWRTEVKYG